MCKYVNSDDSCIYNKHARVQNKGSHVGKKKTEIEADSYEADSYINMTQLLIIIDYAFGSLM